ncbi:hypothetical protein POY61_11615, partial [Phocaeicola vulgatus]|nr:hypothetical protein [Phocaeicola vulgatus]
QGNIGLIPHFDVETLCKYITIKNYTIGNRNISISPRTDIRTITRYFFIVFKRNEKRVQNYKLLPAVPIPNNRYI